MICKTLINYSDIIYIDYSDLKQDNIHFKNEKKCDLYDFKNDLEMTQKGHIFVGIHPNSTLEYV